MALAALTLYARTDTPLAERVLLAIAHTGLDVRIVEADLAQPGADRSEPGGPVLDDGARLTAGTVAILRRLDQAGPARPLFPREPARAAEAELLVEWFERCWREQLDVLLAEQDRDAPDRDVMRRAAYSLQGRLSVFERLLEGRDYLLGERGVLDCVAHPYLRCAALDGAPQDLVRDVLAQTLSLSGAHPRLRAWIDRVSAERLRGSGAAGGPRRGAT